MYAASLDSDTSRLVQLRMAPMRAQKMRIRHADRADTAWLRDTIHRVSHSFTTRVEVDSDGMLAVRPD
jgi:poly-gamma-glutamate synthesis protein (capsule biosynthesis protein)